MGKIYSMLMRPVRTFNIANRAENIISREKPVPAPHYESTEKQKRLADQVNPNFLENHYRKNAQLDQRLRNVFVTSTNVQETITVGESKPLPQSKHRTDNFQFDLYEPITIPVGKCSLKQTLAFLSQHKHDPVKYNSENIAAQYTMDKKVVDNILKHFKLYVSVVPNQPDVIEIDPMQELIDEKWKEKDRKKLTKSKN